MLKGTFIYLGVSTGTGTRGPYYNLQIMPEGKADDAIKIRCEAEVFELGMMIERFKPVDVTMSLRMWQGNPIIRATGIEEHV